MAVKYDAVAGFKVEVFESSQPHPVTDVAGGYVVLASQTVAQAERERISEPTDVSSRIPKSSSRD
jgi:hypothetical protein